MMFWFGNEMGEWGYAIMAISMVLFWGAVATGVILLLRSRGSDGRRDRQMPASHSAQQVLSERFARGEIDETEYSSRVTVLRQSGSGL